MARNTLKFILFSVLLILFFSSCSQVQSVANSQSVLVTEYGITSVGTPEVLMAIEKSGNSEQIKSILKERASILVSCIKKMDTRWEDTYEKFDDHLNYYGIRSGVGFTDLFMSAKDDQTKNYKVIFRKMDKKIYLSVIG